MMIMFYYESLQTKVPIEDEDDDDDAVIYKMLSTPQPTHKCSKNKRSRLTSGELYGINNHCC